MQTSTCGAVMQYEWKRERENVSKIVHSLFKLLPFWTPNRLYNLYECKIKVHVYTFTNLYKKSFAKPYEYA